MVVFGISFRFRRLSRCEGQIAHVLLTRSPLVYSRRSLTARLACVKHAASVRPEPGSNSPLKLFDAHCKQCPSNQWSIPARAASRSGKIEKTSSYQRNRRTTCPSKLGQLVDGALINSSSTFGTLLSSQGSCAHRGPSLSAGPWGNPH